MPYPGNFYRLVLIGDQYGDIWNTTLSLVPNGLGEIIELAVDQATADDVRDIVGTWFTGTVGLGGVSFLESVRLTSIKLNRIDANGHYEDPDPIESIFPVPLEGPSSGNGIPQLSMVATLRTAVARGRGSHGRMFLPPLFAMSTIGVDGRVGAAQAEDVADGVAALINDLNDKFSPGGIGIARVGVASNAGAGRFEHVTRVTVGRVVDTMRSRRSALAEDPQESVVAVEA